MLIQSVSKPFTGFNIIFGIQDITLRLKQNHYAFRHLGYSYLSPDMRDVITRVLKVFLVNFIIDHVVLPFSDPNQRKVWRRLSISILHM